jgi:hypothetical protein
VWVPGVNALWAVRQNGSTLLEVRHYSAPEWVLQAYCANTGILVSAVRGFSTDASLSIFAPAGTGLRPGTFLDNGERNSPTFFMSAAAFSCVIGRVVNFTITDVEYVSGTGNVPRLAATFLQTCSGTADVVRGGVQLIDPPSGRGVSSAPVICVK